MYNPSEKIAIVKLNGELRTPWGIGHKPGLNSTDNRGSVTNMLECYHAIRRLSIHLGELHPNNAYWTTRVTFCGRMIELYNDKMDLIKLAENQIDRDNDTRDMTESMQVQL